MSKCKRIVYDEDYQHGSNNKVYIGLDPRPWLVYKIGDRKTVFHEALLEARVELEKAIEEIDQLLLEVEERMRS